MYDHCTGVGAEKTENQTKFTSSIGEILKATELRSRSINELWEISWDKPVWSWGSAKTASEVRDLCVRNNLFQSYQNFSKDDDLNIATLKGLRNPKETLVRIKGLHKNFEPIYGAYEKAVSKILDQNNIDDELNSTSKNIDSIRKIIGVSPYEGINTLVEKFNTLRGYKTGWATKLHTLADYGFPVCKTDIWIVRLTQALAEVRIEGVNSSIIEFFRDKNPNFSLNLSEWSGKFLEKNPEFSFWLIDYLVENHFDFEDPFWIKHNLDVSRCFNAHRIADLLLAKFGMKLEVNFGLVESPMDMLDPCNPKCRPDLIQNYPDLSLLAKKASQLRASPVVAEKKLSVLTRHFKKVSIRSIDVQPPEVDEYRGKLTAFRQHIFDAIIKSLRVKKVGWDKILLLMLRTPPDQFEDTKF